jgi:DNA topoisomerase-2
MKKSIEEKYKSMDEISHILIRSGMYVGSIKYEEKDCFIYNLHTGKFEMKIVNYIPAMLKVVDEVISNSVDEFRRKDNMGLTELRVVMNKDNGEIIVRDNGGIPIVKHKEAGVYVPEFIFGRLRTSSNYDDTEDRNVIGTNGVGSALCNVFSAFFEIESADGKNEFHRSWSNNMEKLNNDLKVTKCGKKTHYTQTRFKLDFSRFETDLNTFDDDFINIIHKRCIDAAAANPGLTVIFNCGGEDIEWKFKKLDEYIDLYSNILNVADKIPFENDLCTALIFPDSSVDVGFVNGAECSKGTHMRALRQEINQAVVDYISKKDKIKDLTTRGVDNKYSVFININVSNPAYDSQTKDTLTTPIEKFSKDEKIKWEVNDKFLNKIIKSEIVALVRDWYKQKTAAEDEKALRKINRETNKGLKRPDKYITCSSRKKNDRQLWIFEGDSAKAGFRGGRNPDIQAGYTMRGVPLNCYGMTPLQIMKNEVFNDIVTILGLKWGKEFDINELNFGKIVISTDADVDGDKIASLLLLFFNNWPELIEKGIVCRSISPIIISRKGKDCKKFYTMEEFKAEEKKLKGYSHKYAKGLGGLSNQESKEMYQEPKFLYFKKDEAADSMFRKWFAKGDSETRKQMLNS